MKMGIFGHLHTNIKNLSRAFKPPNILYAKCVLDFCSCQCMICWHLKNLQILGFTRISNKSSQNLCFWRILNKLNLFINPPMPDSKSAQSWYFFSILEINNFLGFQNVFPKLHDPSWFCQFFVFPWIFRFFLCLITRDRFFKKMMQNEMIMFFLKRDLGRNLSTFCVKK